MQDGSVKMTNEVVVENIPYTCGVCKIVFDNDCPISSKCKKPVCPSCSLHDHKRSADYCPLCDEDTGWDCKSDESYTTSIKDDSHEN